MRIGPTARLATTDDHPGVVDLLRSARAESPLGPQLCSPDSTTLDGQLVSWCSMPGATLVVAELGGDIVGMALAVHVDVNLFADHRYLMVEALYVHPDHRRRGAGHALLQQVAEVAAAGEAVYVVTMPLTGNRSEQRFLSSLGFSPAAMRRFADTQSLLRRLAPQQRATARRGRTIDDIIARRRRSRGLPPTPAAGIDMARQRTAGSGR